MSSETPPKLSEPQKHAVLTFPRLKAGRQKFNDFAIEDLRLALKRAPKVSSYLAPRLSKRNITMDTNSIDEARSHLNQKNYAGCNDILVILSDEACRMFPMRRSSMWPMTMYTMTWKSTERLFSVGDGHSRAEYWSCNYRELYCSTVEFCELAWSAAITKVLFRLVSTFLLFTYDVVRTGWIDLFFLKFWNNVPIPVYFSFWRLKRERHKKEMLHLNFSSICFFFFLNFSKVCYIVGGAKVFIYPTVNPIRDQGNHDSVVAGWAWNKGPLLAVIIFKTWSSKARFVIFCSFTFVRVKCVCNFTGCIYAVRLAR